MKLEILGTGCPKCQKLTELVKEAVAELNATAEIVKVTNINDIMNYGVMITPAFSIDGQVQVAGRIPSKDEIKNWISGKISKDKSEGKNFPKNDGEQKEKGCCCC